jgi:hypothetical protein
LSSNADYAPAWEPGDDLPKWAAKLQEPFNPAEVGLRPQIWCPKCRDYQKEPPAGGGKSRCCGMKKDERGSGGVDHDRKKCADCGQAMTAAHMHLSYVGHAHITERLLQADPRWYWRPIGRDIPDEVMAAAIGTGDLGIVQAVINAYPPKIIEIAGPNGRAEHIMWGEVIIHDENGDEVVMPGVGDAIGKNWDPNAVKEMLGDLFRNALMRHGAGLDMWKKEDADRAKRERDAAGADDPGGYAARAAMFDQDQAGEGSQAQPARRRGRQAQAKQEDALPPIDPEAQASADLAVTLGKKPGITIAALEAEYEKALAKKVTTKMCVDSATGETVKVFQVWGRVRRAVEGLPVPGHDGKA